MGVQLLTVRIVASRRPVPRMRLEKVPDHLAVIGVPMVLAGVRTKDDVDRRAAARVVGHARRAYIRGGAPHGRLCGRRV